MDITVVGKGTAAILITLKGHIDEHAADELMQLRGQLVADRITIDLGGVKHVNSIGIVAWSSFVQELPRGVPYVFENCPSNVLDTAQIIATFFGTGKVDSFYLTYTCGKCRKEHEVLMRRAALVGQTNLPQVACPKCKASSSPRLALEDLDFLLK